MTEKSSENHGVMASVSSLDEARQKKRAKDYESWIPHSEPLRLEDTNTIDDTLDYCRKQLIKAITSEAIESDQEIKKAFEEKQISLASLEALSEGKEDDKSFCPVFQIKLDDTIEKFRVTLFKNNFGFVDTSIATKCERIS